MLPDRWLALSVSLPECPAEPTAGDPDPSLPEELIPQALLELGGRGVEEEGGTFTTYLEPPEDPDATAARARRRLEEATGGMHLEVRWRWQPQEDWDRIWREGLGPRRVTSRLVVAPSWDPPVLEAGEVLLTLDPGVAFGTAEHPTTRGCLRLMDERIREGDRVVDVGAGSGILSIAAVLLGAGEALALEVDPSACQAAEENVRINGVAGRVRIVRRMVEPGAPLCPDPADGIMANIQRTVLLPLLPAFLAGLRPGGWLLLSGSLREERAEVLKAAAGTGFTHEGDDEEGEWWSGAFGLPSARAGQDRLPERG